MVRRLAFTGEVAPGTTLRYVDFSGTPVPGGGRPGWFARIGDPHRPDHAVFYGDSGDVTAVFRRAAPPPGVPVFDDPIWYRVNDAGRVVVSESIVDQLGIRTSGIWVGGLGGDFTPLARPGDPAIMFGAAMTYAEVGRPELGAAGHVLFEVRLTGPGITPDNDQAIVLVPPSGEWIVVRRDGDPLPIGTGSFSGLSNFASLNARGDVAFRALATGGPDATLLRDADTGAVTHIALAGTVAPGTGGKRYRGALPGSPEVSINDRGEVAFGYVVDGIGSVIFAGTPGALAPIARVGDPVPGSPSDRITGFRDEHPATMLDNGWVSFAATTDRPGPAGTVVEGLFLWDGTQVRPLLVDGESFPGLPPGIYIGDGPQKPSTSFPHLIAESGWVVGRVDLSGPDLHELNDRMLYALNMFSGERHLIVRTGDVFPDAPAEVGRVVRIGLMQRVPDENTVLFELGFADGSEGVYSVVVPEPTPWTLWPLLLLFRHRARR